MLTKKELETLERLSKEWDDKYNENYPSSFLSFDEIVIEIQEWLSFHE